MIFRPSPLRLAPTGGSLCRGRGRTRPYPRQTVQFLIHHITFCLFVNRFFPEKCAKGHFSTRHSRVTAGPLSRTAKKGTPLRAFLLYLLVSVLLSGVLIHAAEEHVVASKLQHLTAFLLVEGHNTALGVHPNAPHIFNGMIRFHRKAPFLHRTRSFALLSIRRFDFPVCFIFREKIFNFFRRPPAPPPRPP